MDVIGRIDDVSNIDYKVSGGAIVATHHRNPIQCLATLSKKESMRTFTCVLAVSAALLTVCRADAAVERAVGFRESAFANSASQSSTNS